MVRVRIIQSSAVLRRQSQSNDVCSGGVQTDRVCGGLVLRVQAFITKASVRRQPPETIEFSERQSEVFDLVTVACEEAS